MSKDLKSLERAQEKKRLQDEKRRLKKKIAMQGEAMALPEHRSSVRCVARVGYDCCWSLSRESGA